MRKTLIVTHRWVALVVSVFLLCAAASGTAMVFEGAIDRGLNPHLWQVQASGQPLAIDTLVARVEAKFPAAKVGSVGLSPTNDRAWTLNAGPLTVTAAVTCDTRNHAQICRLLAPPLQSHTSPATRRPCLPRSIK